MIYLKCLLNHFVFHLGPPTISNLRQPNPKPTKLGPIFVGKLRLDFLSLFLTTNQCDSSIRLKYLSMGAWETRVTLSMYLLLPCHSAHKWIPPYILIFYFTSSSFPSTCPIYNIWKMAATEKERNTRTWPGRDKPAWKKG